MAEGKPFMIGKYVRGRIRVALAEGVATGGAGTGLYHPITNEVGRQVMTRHHRFVHAHRDLYAQATPRVEVGLVLPRQSVLNRQPDAYRTFRTIGQSFTEEQILFDVVLDQRLIADRLAGYTVVVLPEVLSLSDEQRAMIRGFVEAGGSALIVGDVAVMDEHGRARASTGIFAAEQPGEPDVWASLRRVARGRVGWLDADRAAEAVGRLAPLCIDTPLSTIGASWKVRTAVFDRAGGMMVHLVNYDRDEEAGGRERAPEFESPIAVRDVTVELNLPEGVTVESVRITSPDTEHVWEPGFTMSHGRVRLTVPQIETYALVDVRYAQEHPGTHRDGSMAP